MVYFILDLEQFGKDIHIFLRKLEEVVCLTLLDYNIRSSNINDLTGVWIQNIDTNKYDKICSIGIRTNNWTTMHGLSLNVNTDLGYFDAIDPCGLKDIKMTSMERLLKRKIDLKEVGDSIEKNIKLIFNTNLEYL